MYGRGRFLAGTSAYLDPEIYSEGKMAILAGKIAGAGTRPLDETVYRYPVVRVQEVRLVDHAYPERYCPDYHHGGPGPVYAENPPYRDW
jgi:starvation-inducible outer membrane lipoprotein